MLHMMETRTYGLCAGVIAVAALGTDAAAQTCPPTCLQCVPMTVELAEWHYWSTINAVEVLWRATFHGAIEADGKPHDRVFYTGGMVYPDSPSCGASQDFRIACTLGYGDTGQVRCYYFWSYGNTALSVCAAYCPDLVEQHVTVPPLQPEKVEIRAEQCNECPGKNARTIWRATYNGVPTDYHAKISRTVVQVYGTDQLLGSNQTFDLPPGQFVITGQCDGKSVSLVQITEYCGSRQLRTDSMLWPEGCWLYPQPKQDDVRDTIRGRTQGRTYFRVRTPFAVMGVRGFTAADTVIRGVQSQVGSEIRWMRITDSALAQAESSGTLLLPELLADGPLSTGSHVSGTHTPTLVMNGYGDADAGSYLMFEIPAGGTMEDAVQREATALVEDIGQPVIVSNPMPLEVCASQIDDPADPGKQVHLSVQATSSDASEQLSYHWYINGKRLNWGGPFLNRYNDSIQYRFGASDFPIDTPVLTLLDFHVGSAGDDGMPPRNVTFWVECEVYNSHGSARTRPVPVTIDLSMNDCDDDGTTDACEIATGAPDMNGDFIPDACQCLGDIDRNGAVDGADLGALLSSWGPITNAAPAIDCDLNADGAINGADLGAMLSRWGPCGP